jgi:hypothetical protein
MLLLVSIILSGCLVSDKSTTDSVQGDLDKARPIAAQIINQFFSYNQYDPDPNSATYSEYNVDGLIELLNSDKNGAILEIDPILGSNYDKSFVELKGELEELEPIFRRQTNYKLLFVNPKGEKSYKKYSDSLDGNYYTSRYLFQVFEEKEGELVLTDNGHITFTLKYVGDSKWLIDYIFIDYKGLGSITL